MKNVKYKISKINSEESSRIIKESLKKYFGDDLEVEVKRKKVSITYDENKVMENEIKAVLKNAGYVVDNPHSIEVKKRELILSIALSIPLLIGMFGHIPITADYIPKIFTNSYLQLLLATIIQFYIGKHFYMGAYYEIKNRSLGMGFLVALASTSAYVYSVFLMITNGGKVHQELYFEVGAIVITVVLIGHYLEAKMQVSTTSAIDGLLKLNPKSATRIKNNEEEEINYNEINDDDILLVLAGTNIPADGVIVEGQTYVNESSFTGESVPVMKKVGQSVIGGSINQNSTIKIKVTATGNKSVLNQIITSIQEATISDTKYQRLADKIASIFAPFIVVVSILTFIITYAVLNDVTTAINHSLAVIVIGCPCALGLATPTSIMVSNQVATKHGLLYKSPKFFELADQINVIAFDKTGTITKGYPTVERFDIQDDGVDLLYALERNSQHPISKQVVKYLKGKVNNELNIDQIEVLPGFGIKGEYENQVLTVTNYRYLEDKNIDYNGYEDLIKKYYNEGKTLSIFVKNNIVLGYFTVEDEIKEGVIEVIQKLKDLKIKPLMITGDNEQVAKRVANKVGIEEVYAEVLPIKKAEIIKKYKKQSKVVAMIGDGINDSVALKTADVGISVKGASDIASEASDVILMKKDLQLIVDGITISQRTNRNIKQNFMWAFSYNIIAIPLAATGNISMILAAFVMGFSSIVVVFNALRLKNDKEIKKLK